MLKKIITPITICLISFVSIFPINASAAKSTLRLKIYETNSFITKNGVPNAFYDSIDNPMRAVSGMYYVCFGINIKYDFSNQYNITNKVIENCSYISGSNYTNYCNHETNSSCNNSGPYHHNNGVYLMSQNLPQYDVVLNARLLLTANNLCCKSGSEHIGVRGLANSNYNTLIVQDYETPKGINTLKSVIAHEIGHLYGAKDHGTDMNNANCIYGSKRYSESVMNNMTICDECKKVIRDNSSRFAHD
ncbi:hypothetical protein [uncultured Ruminococcus sp.]|uniref:hypothetical protein n=2 Tax=uncultured Ruminococcus sp. TaxID=165186 RepID=UPI0025CD4C3C|nr:hypothetical protein [uncultured Ruminococcus sp.]